MYYGARYYDPQISNWISTDPALPEYLPKGGDVYFPEEKFDAKRLKGSGGIYNSLNLSLYTYSHENPVKLVDPDGRNPALALAPALIPLGPAGWVTLGAIAVVSGVGLYMATRSNDDVKAPAIPISLIESKKNEGLIPLVHFTSPEGAQAIMRSGAIKPSADGKIYATTPDTLAKAMVKGQGWVEKILGLTPGKHKGADAFILWVKPDQITGGGPAKGSGSNEGGGTEVHLKGPLRIGKEVEPNPIKIPE